MVTAFSEVLPRRSGEGEKNGITGFFQHGLRLWGASWDEDQLPVGHRERIGPHSRLGLPGHPRLAKESATPSLSSQLNRSGRVGTISLDRSRWLRLLPRLGRTRSDCFSMKPIQCLTRSKRFRRGRPGRERAPEGRRVGPSLSRSGDLPAGSEGHRQPETLKCASPLRRSGSGPSSGTRICRHPRGNRRRRRPRFCSRNR